MDRKSVSLVSEECQQPKHLQMAIKVLSSFLVVLLFVLVAYPSHGAEFRFKCPENLSNEERDRSYQQFLDYCAKEHPNWTLREVADYRMKLLTKHNCRQTLENIGKDANTPSTGTAYTTYTNAKFGFKIQYPKSFVVEKTLENGDGIELKSADGEAELRLLGGSNPGFTTKNYYDMKMKGLDGQPGYKVLKDSWFVITWKTYDRLNYLKMFVGPDSYSSFLFTFPSDERAAYEDIVTKIEKSFRHPSKQAYDEDESDRKGVAKCTRLAAKMFGSPSSRKHKSTAHSKPRNVTSIQTFVTWRATCAGMPPEGPGKVTALCEGFAIAPDGERKSIFYWEKVSGKTLHTGYYWCEY